jgi:hypothetical protein
MEKAKAHRLSLSREEPEQEAAQRRSVGRRDAHARVGGLSGAAARDERRETRDEGSGGEECLGEREASRSLIPDRFRLAKVQNCPLWSVKP